MSIQESGPLEILNRIRKQPAPQPRPGEVCEMCRAEIPDQHPHLVDVKTRGLMCSCRPCWLLFTPEGSGGGHFKAVPERYLAVSDLSLSPGQWDALQIPVSIAFFFHNSELDRIAAFYPSPAGATESLLALEAWQEVVADNPVLATLLSDVEAVLLREERGATECFIVPIDTCYELVGRLRQCWRGFDGGKEAHEELTAFFDNVRQRAGRK